ncbi:MULTISPECIES: hypothetical protein [unclassified Actinomyces]|uniref:hypothetical protein n=1 Tax=unclassified Actinomyces TaxID=2609248 RepID=UPI002016E326|nr:MULTISPECIES: hypothetical protein [unclassified Actinomyces]MCL3776702.1 hypothetical protein [Actinomyces sp. AC-20-1]MCL3790543.1 hypothetical protein [Actinomyces sp. 187325]MCL3792839.1 hypothetical protein [Actinomyces sp. 186855]MCL3795309.1 hypothetical protein [Actinomyces sp. 217892]
MTSLWLRDVAGGVADATRHWRDVLAIAVIGMVVCAVVATLLGETLMQWTIFRRGATLRDQQAVTFSVSYSPHGRVSSVSGSSLDLLTASMESGHAYSAVVANVRSSEPSTGDGPPVVVVVGDLAAHLYPELGLCETAPCATSGTKVVDAPQEITLAGTTIEVQDHHPAGSVWFDPAAGGIDLDTLIMVRIAPHHTAGLGALAQEELVWRAVLTGPSAQEVRALVASASADGLWLTPRYLTNDEPARFRSLLAVAAIYLVSFLSLLVACAYALSAVAVSVLRRTAAEFAIRRVSGAMAHSVVVRMAAFLTTVMAPSLLVAAAVALAPPFTYVSTGGMAVLVSLLVIDVVAVACGARAVLSEKHMGS